MTASPSPTATDAGACARYEPNETNAQAYGPAGNGETLRAALCPGDAWDLYYFVLGSGAEAQIDLTEIPDGVDYDLYLYPGGGGAPIASSTAPGSMAERIRVALSPGRYLVRVYPATGSSEAEYSLRVGW
jgi:hypothetical protein